MAPRDGAFWRANQLVEKIEHRDLIGESFLNGPACSGVGRPGERKTARQHVQPCNRVAYVFCGIGAAWGHKTVAIKKKRAVPVRWNFDEISGAVRQRTRVLREA